MNLTSARGPQALMSDYAAIARKRGPGVVEATALRTESLGLRELVAFIASQGRLTLAQIEEHLDSGQAPALDPVWGACLGRILALQNFHARDRTDAIALLDACVGKLPGGKPTQVYRKLRAELHFAAEDYVAVAGILRKDKSLVDLGDGYLATDLLNPFIGSPYADPAKWAADFMRPFLAAGIEAPEVVPGQGTPLDRLTTSAPARSVDGPLVTVVLTTFRPERYSLLASARSILDQTWSNLEVLIVDDASPAEFDDLLAEVVAADSRVRLVKLESNGGTYKARNRGITEARGEFMTCQDADDWSHPRRIEKQVLPLIKDVTLPATRSRCIAVQSQLVSQRPGYPSSQPNASSLMFRTESARAIDGFLRVRRAADTEFHRRLVAWSGCPSLDIAKPLALIRILPDSLSRGDFRAGWSHPARRAFTDSYTWWHENSRRAALMEASSPAIAAPDRFAVEPRVSRTFDVVFAGDWRAYGGPQKSMLEEIAALRSAGYSVGVMHLEAIRFMTRASSPLCGPVQELINSGAVTQLLMDDAHSVRLLVLRYPPILQFAPRSPSTLVVERLVILANQAPSERDGTDIRYDARYCADEAQRLFATPALWVPQGPNVRREIVSSLRSEEVAAFDMPGILDLAAWRTERRSLRSDRPVIGRHSRDNTMKWPEDPATLALIYPTDGRFDVRTMGGTRAALAVLEGVSTPSAWVSFDKDELPVRTFLNSLDFFVNFTHSQAYEAFGRAILEGIAAGCITILPPHFEETFGDAAVYCEPAEVAPTISRLYADTAAFQAQVTRAWTAVSTRFSHESYRSLVAEMLGQPALIAVDEPAR